MIQALIKIKKTDLDKKQKVQQELLKLSDAVHESDESYVYTPVNLAAFVEKLKEQRIEYVLLSGSYLQG